MKLYRIIFIVAVVLVSKLTHAQVAIVNSQKVITSMPVFKKLDTLVNNEKERYTLEYNKKQVIVNRSFAIADSLFKIDQKAGSTLKAINEAQAADKELKAFAETANKKVFEYKQFLEQPYIDKIMLAIKTIAVSKKLMMVVDEKTIGSFYINPIVDITNDVIKVLKK